MRIEKGYFIKDISPGLSFTAVFLVQEMSKLETKNGKPYLRLSLIDKSGEINAMLWDNAEQAEPSAQPGSYIQVEATEGSYQNKQQLTLKKLVAVSPEQVDPADFIISGEIDKTKLSQELEQMIKGVKNSFIKKLLQSIFSPSGINNEFQQAPAAKRMHHAYLGGLLEHSVGVARLAQVMSDLYPYLDRDILLAGALLHDIGKIEEFDYQGYPFNYKTRGRLVGHLLIGAELIGRHAEQIADFPAPLLEQLQHLILSHHGQHQFGAAVLPMTPEAFVLHVIDDIDAKINYFNGLSRKLKTPEQQWTDYQQLFDRYLFLPGSRPDESEERAEPRERKEPISRATKLRKPNTSANTSNSWEKPSNENIQPSLFGG